MDIITAKEALEIAMEKSSFNKEIGQDLIDELMYDIGERIEDTANKGLTWISYEPPSKYYYCVGNCVAQLTQAGYSVKVNNKLVGKPLERIKMSTLYSLEISWNE